MSTQDLGPRQRAAATKRARTRRWILDAARPLCDEHGYQGTTREQVAKAAGVGMATLHNHFPLKRALVVAAYEPELLPFIKSTREITEARGNAEVALITFVRKLAVMMADHRTLCRALLPIGCEENPADQFHPAFHELAEIFGELIAAYLESDSHYGNESSDVARYHLTGLLGAISPPNPPRPADEASTFVLSMIL